VKQRLVLLKRLNTKVKDIMQYINFNTALTNHKSYLMSVYQQQRSLIFSSIKNEMVKTLLKKDQSSSSTNITVNRHKAHTLQMQNKVDVFGEQSVFGQVFRQFKEKDNGYNALKSSGQAFDCDFVGEGSIDAGGPYNECIA
jgi:hypothetical protein